MCSHLLPVQVSILLALVCLEKRESNDISDKLIETICTFLCQILDFYISKSLFGPEEI